MVRREIGVSESEEVPPQAAELPCQRLILASSRRAARLVVPMAGDRVLVTGGAAWQGDAHEGELLMPPGHAKISRNQLVQNWLEAEAEKLDPAYVATWLSLHSFLIHWIDRQLHFANSLERKLEQLAPRSLVAAGLPVEQQELARVYAKFRKLDFRVSSPLSWLVRQVRQGVFRTRSVSTGIGRSFRARTRRVLMVPRRGLVVCALQPNSTRSFMSVAKALRKRDEECIFLMREEDTKSRRFAEAEGFVPLLVENYAGFSDAPSAVRASLALGSKLTDGRLEPLLRTFGFPSWVDVGALALTKMTGLDRSIQRFFVDVSMMRRALDNLDPKACIFITSRVMMNRLLNERQRVKKIFFLQGIVPEIPPAGTRLEVDLAIVGSKIDVPYLQNCDVPPEVRRITGYPDYDHLSSLNTAECRKKLRASVPQIEESPIVLFTSQYAKDIFPDWAREKNLRTLAETARAMPHVTFLIKPHPVREKLSAGLMSELPANVAVCTLGDTFAAIKGADVMVTYWSTTALEAVLLGTPLVQLNSTGLPDFFDISKRLGRPVVRDPAALGEAIQRFLDFEQERATYAEQRLAFLRNYDLNTDGNAAVRVAEAILDSLDA